MLSDTELQARLSTGGRELARAEHDNEALGQRLERALRVAAGAWR